MNYLKQLYRNDEKLWCNIIFPLVLFFYPLLTVNQGVDVSDSTYSLSNFLFFENMEGMWVISTYLANVCGWILTRLPFGATLLGMKVYTGLVVSITVLLVYRFLRKWMPAWIIFLGELIAVGFLWIPTTILYNYLTYFFFTMGTIFLFKGLVEEKNGWLIAAGISLGLNVFVRIPNLTEAALILGLWYYLASEGKTMGVMVKKTGYCIAGYLLGLLLPLTAVLIQFGLTGLIQMIRDLGAIQEADASYSPFAMVTAVFEAYFRSAKWMVLIAIAISLGMAMFIYQKGKYEKLKKLIYLAGVVVLLRFLWGRGMFSFRYYEDYTSMFEWGMAGLYLAWISGVYMLASRKTSPEEKLMAVLSMVILVITPLGSNNYTYQNLNNLFLLAPFTLYTFVKVYRYREGDGLLSGLRFPWKTMVAVMGAMIFIQSAGFHLQFAFRDGMDGTPRDYKLTGPSVLGGMKTTRENAQSLAGLYSCLDEAGVLGRPVILYGDCPGLSFLFNMPFAISTAWPDLASHPYRVFVEELMGLKERPVVIMRQREGYGETAEKKKAFLLEWMENASYDCIYDNKGYRVFLVD